MGTTIKLRRDTEVDVQSNIPQEYEPIIQIEKTLSGGPQDGMAVKDYWLYLGDGEVSGGYPIPSANDIFAMVSYAIDQTKVLSKQLAIGELGGGSLYLPVAGGTMTGAISGNNLLALYSNVDTYGMGLELSYNSGTPANSTATFTYSTDGVTYSNPFKVTSAGMIYLGKSATISATISPASLSANRAFTLPDTSGEIAVVTGGTSTTVVTGVRANAGTYMTGQISFISGLGITVTQGASPNTITITATGAVAPAPHASTHSAAASDPITISNLAGSLSVTQQNSLSLVNIGGTINSTQHSNLSATTSTLHCAQSISIAGSGVGGYTNLEDHAISTTIHHTSLSTLSGSITASQHGTTLPWSTSKHLLDAHMLPTANWTYDLGSAAPSTALGWRNIYARQLEFTDVFSNRVWLSAQTLNFSSFFTLTWNSPSTNLVRFGKDVAGSGNTMLVYGDIAMNSTSIKSLSEPSADTSAATLLTTKKTRTCTYTVDASGFGDYSTLDAAMLALGSNDGEIYIKKGTYTISANATYSSLGNLIIRSDSGATFSAVTNKTLAFNSSGSTKSLKIQNLKFSNVSISGSSWKTVMVESVIGSTASNITFSGESIIVKDCNHANGYIDVTGSRHITVSDNTLVSSRVIANISSVFGECSVLDNHIDNSSSGGTCIDVSGGNDTFISVRGNNIIMYQASVSSDLYGIQVTATGSSDVSDNAFYGYTGWPASGYGIYAIVLESERATVRGNTFIDFVSTANTITTIHCIGTLASATNTAVRSNVRNNCGSFPYYTSTGTINTLAGSDYAY